MTQHVLRDNAGRTTRIPPSAFTQIIAEPLTKTITMQQERACRPPNPQHFITQHGKYLNTVRKCRSQSLTGLRRTKAAPNAQTALKVTGRQLHITVLRLCCTAAQ